MEPKADSVEEETQVTGHIRSYHRLSYQAK